MPNDTIGYTCNCTEEYGGFFCEVELGTRIPSLFFYLTLSVCLNFVNKTNEPPRDKANNVVVRPAKTHISLGI